MTPLLFAVVDAWLWAQWRKAVEVGRHPAVYRHLRARVGWWRSTWGLR